MTWSLIVQEDPGSFAPSRAPAPYLVVLATVTFVLMALSRYFYLQGNQRRSRMAQSPENPDGDPSESLPSEDVDRLDPTLPLAVFLVGGGEPIGPPSLRIFGSLYAKEYPQILFVSVGVMDYKVVDSGAEGRGNFRGTEEAKRLKRHTRLALDPYLAGAHKIGLKADCRVSVATNAVDEIDLMSDEITAQHPRAVFFVSKLVFQKPRWFHRFLHSGTSDAIRKRLEMKGFPVTVLPVVLSV